jgi:hypothetical protein
MHVHGLVLERLSFLIRGLHGATPLKKTRMNAGSTMFYMVSVQPFTEIIMCFGYWETGHAQAGHVSPSFSADIMERNDEKSCCTC